MLLFLAIALLEDSGYMARAAFVMDQFMHKFDLHGKSFIPMLIGFGCSVPAIMATRTLENERDRLTTMLVTPLMSCGARLPIYALIIPAFFPQSWRAPMLMLVYLIGIALALLGAKLLRATLLRGESTPFVMELPPYRLPTIQGAFLHMGQRSWLYVRKAGTVILAISIVLWALTSYPKKTMYDEDYDGQAAQATAKFMSDMKALNPILGLPSNSESLTRLAEAELAVQAVQAHHYEHDPAYLEAVQATETVIESLRQSEQGHAVDAFLTVREAIRAARQEFSDSVEADEVEAGTHAHLLLEHWRDTALARARSEHPEAYRAAVTYLEDVEGPYQAALEDIEQSKRGEQLAYSIAGRVGRVLEPVLQPMGFDWRIGTALIGAVAAKEVFVAQMGIVFSVGEADEGSEALRARLRAAYSPLVAFCIMLFCLVSAPCMATIATTRSEANSTKWALFQFGALTALAWVLTVAVYQVGTLLGLGAG
jgi:ferrous iron transport protein B